MIDENQIHMVLYFGGFLLGGYGPIIWAVQWFMLFNNMIKDENAMKKATYARNSYLVYILVEFCGVLLN
jgi:hypothetical protein